MITINITIMIDHRATTHRVHRVPQHGHVSLAPALEDRWASVVQVPLLDDLVRRVACTSPHRMQ